MENTTAHFSAVFMGFFAIMNPIANAPIFIGLTDGLDGATRRGVAVRAILLAFAIVAAFTILGRTFFAVFGITLPAFRIAGGILVALVGYQLLHGKDSSVHTPTDEDNVRSRDAALGIAITAMSFAAETTTPEMIRVLSAFALVCVLTLATFLGSGPIVRILGQNAIKVVSRLMGLILAVIGVQMLIIGIQGAISAASAA
jgi:multiple antibiotic resistance protein